jgi:hypothetical protein
MFIFAKNFADVDVWKAKFVKTEISQAIVIGN